MTEPNKPKTEAADSLKKDEAARLAEVLKSDEGSKLDSVIWPAQRAGWAIERRVIWPLGDALRRLAEVATWPFERVIWAFRSRVAWPVQDEFAGRGRAVRTTLAVGAVGVAVAAASAGAITSTSGGGSDRSVPAPVAQAKPAPLEAPRTPLAFIDVSKLDAGPVLHGVAPSFKVSGPKGTGDQLASTNTDATTTDSGPVDTPPTIPGDPSSSAKEEKVAPATVKPALDVSREFAGAFVRYEIGKGNAKVDKTFKKTAAKNLVIALKKRPPRLPKGVKVPKAKVLNVVPGPRHGKALSVSVALVRLGASSELRLELRHDDKAGWLVSDVRG